jgi:hypothetical protein
MYDHLNESDPVRMPGTMADLVRNLRAQNYGVHRFLSELVRQREASEEDKQYPERREHTAMLRRLLEEKGFF